jgi:hypothetical protein
VLFEVIRLAKAAMTKRGFDAQLASYRETDAALTEAKRKFDDAERAGADVDDAREQRAEASQDHGRTLGYLAGTVRLHRPHILTIDNMRGDESYRSPVADRLAADVAAEAAAHPLVRAGVATDATALAAALTAVSTAASRVGAKLAWDRLKPGRVEVVSTEIWLDTGLSPTERASGS